MLITNQWTVFFVHSDWLLKLQIVSAINLLALFWISRTRFPHFPPPPPSQKKELFRLSTGFVYTYFKKDSFSDPCFIDRSASCSLNLWLLFSTY